VKRSRNLTEIEQPIATKLSDDAFFSPTAWHHRLQHSPAPWVTRGAGMAGHTWRSHPRTSEAHSVTPRYNATFCVSLHSSGSKGSSAATPACGPRNCGHCCAEPTAWPASNTRHTAVSRCSMWFIRSCTEPSTRLLDSPATTYGEAKGRGAAAASPLGSRVSARQCYVTYLRTELRWSTRREDEQCLLFSSARSGPPLRRPAQDRRIGSDISGGRRRLLHRDPALSRLREAVRVSVRQP
jgi:hypothetical protein